MQLFRIGDKVVSRDKLIAALDEILADRQAGATQAEAARHAGVQRNFVSFMETLGEIRRGPKVALVAFPVANKAEVRELAARLGVDVAVVLGQQEREQIEGADASDVFNQLLDTIAVLHEFDTVVVLASDLRIQTLERVLGSEVIGVSLGHSPLREDVPVDLDELERLLKVVTVRRTTADDRRGRVGDALREAASIAGRWTQSKR